MKHPILCLALVLAAAGCRTAPATESNASIDVEAEGQVLPTPFTTEQIQAYCQPGAEIRFRVDGTGAGTLNQVMRFVADDGVNATVESWMEQGGQPLGPPSTEVSSWVELRDHARFPEGTTRERATITVKGGTFDGWAYTSEITDPRGTGVRTMWFADRMPGPPVLMTEVIDGEEVLRMEMIARVLP